MVAEPAAPDVLVVDDDADIRESVSEVLQDEGYRIVQARNGSEALGLLRAGMRPRVILLDLMMPVMDGEAFCRVWEAAPEFAHVPVVLISAHAHSVAKAQSCHATALLRKPFKLDELLRVVGQFASSGVRA